MAAKLVQIVCHDEYILGLGVNGEIYRTRIEIPLDANGIPTITWQQANQIYVDINGQTE